MHPAAVSYSVRNGFPAWLHIIQSQNATSRSLALDIIIAMNARRAKRFSLEQFSIRTGAECTSQTRGLALIHAPLVFWADEFCNIMDTHFNAVWIRFCCGGERFARHSAANWIICSSIIPPCPNRNRVRIIARWRINLKCNLLRATNERSRRVCVLPTPKAATYCLGMSNLGCWDIVNIKMKHYFWILV